MTSRSRCFGFVVWWKEVVLCFGIWWFFYVLCKCLLQATRTYRMYESSLRNPCEATKILSEIFQKWTILISRWVKSKKAIIFAKIVTMKQFLSWFSYTASILSLSFLFSHINKSVFLSWRLIYSFFAGCLILTVVFMLLDILFKKATKEFR